MTFQAFLFYQQSVYMFTVLPKIQFIQVSQNFFLIIVCDFCHKGKNPVFWCRTASRDWIRSTPINFFISSTFFLFSYCLLNWVRKEHLFKAQKTGASLPRFYWYSINKHFYDLVLLNKFIRFIFCKLVLFYQLAYDIFIRNGKCPETVNQYFNSLGSFFFFSFDSSLISSLF